MLVAGLIVLALLIIGAPLGIALAAASVIYIVLYTNMSWLAIGQSFFSFLQSYELMSIPFFVFAGFLMERTGLVRDLFNFAEALIGWIRGGFGIAAVSTCILFGAISGSSVAMASAMSLIIIPELRKRGYPDWLCAGIVVGGGGIALLIPPSLSLILYGIITETSIVALFMAGIIPGLMLGVGMTIIIVTAATILKLPRGKFDIRNVLKYGKVALPGLGVPVIVIGGLYGGLMTPTEAGAVSVGYAILIGLIAERHKFFPKLYNATAEAVNLVAMIFFLLGSVGVFQFVAANEYWPQTIAKAIVDMNLTPMGFLFGYMGVLLIMGMFLDGIAMLVLTLPVIFPVAMQLGVNPIHLGILFSLNIDIAVMTPPVGFNLYAVTGIAKIPLPTVLKGTLPFFLSDSTVLLINMLVPWFSTWLPDLVVKSVF